MYDTSTKILVILFCLSIEAACTEIPYALRSEAPPSQSSSIGSGNFRQAPRAIVFGGAWTAGDVARVQSELEGKIGAEGVVMMMKDGGRDGMPLGPGYGVHIVGRVKSALGRVLDRKDGKDGEGDGVVEGVVWY